MKYVPYGTKNKNATIKKILNDVRGNKDEELFYYRLGIDAAVEEIKRRYSVTTRLARQALDIICATEKEQIELYEKYGAEYTIYELNYWEAYNRRLHPERFIDGEAIKSFVHDMKTGDYKNYALFTERFRKLAEENEKVRFFANDYTSDIYSVDQYFEKNGDFIIAINHGKNMDARLVFVLNGETNEVYCLTGYCHNYGQWRMSCNCENMTDACFGVDVGYGFGSWAYPKYDRMCKKISETSKRNFGCCCD